MAKRYRDQRLLMIFRAFFDESGTSPHENKSLVMGGFVGHIDEWKQASEAWYECLQESPSINHFSRNEAKMLDGQFKFSHLSENEPPSLEPFSIIAKAKPVIHVPCTPPPLIPDTLEIQKLSADVKRSAQCLLKRIYGDKE